MIDGGKMKVILVSYYFREKEKMNFGPFPTIYQLAKKIGHVITAHPFSFSTENIDGITVERCFVFRTPFISNLSQAVFGLGLYKKCKNFDGILHAQDLSAGLGYKLLKKPIKVLTLRGLLISWINTVPGLKNIEFLNKKNTRLTLKLEKMLVENSDYIISPSEFYKGEILKYYTFDENKIKVIPNGIDEKMFSPQEIETDKKILLFAGGLSQRKGYPIAICTHKRLKKRYPELELWVLGNDRTPKERIEGVKFFGSVAYEEMPQFFNNATVVIHPSFNENCPKVIQEAMSCGKPVVTLNVTGNVELIDNYVDGIYASEKNFSREVGNLLEDENLIKELGENARKKVMSKYTFDRMFKEYMKFYNQIEHSIGQ
jgi:glycosyltransferase involved in cell wall biosynthesis